MKEPILEARIAEDAIEIREFKSPDEAMQFAKKLRQALRDKVRCDTTLTVASSAPLKSDDEFGAWVVKVDVINEEEIVSAIRAVADDLGIRIIIDERP